MLLISRICRVFLVLIFLLSAHPASAATIIPYGTGISVDTTWTKAGSPYIVSPMGVASGVTLTIEPGTVIKMKNGTGVGIGGHLIVGTQGGEPVTITSENDDSVGGDTNNDGTTTPPMPGDWGYIVFYTDSTGDFNNTHIRYGGRSWDHGYVEEGQIKNIGGVVSLRGGSMTDNRGMSIYGLGGTTTVRDTVFARSIGAGMYMIDGSLTIGNDTFGDHYGDAVHLRGTMNFSNEGGNSTSDGTIGSIGFDYMSLTGVNVLHPDALSNHVIGGVGVNPGSSLRLLPGVIIKSDAATNIGVLGTLIAGDANTDTPVVFTSWQDDSVGGDSNADGTASLPHYGDWCGLTVYTGGMMNLTHSTLRYGGCVYNVGLVYTYPMIGNTGGILTITNSKIADSGNYGIKNDLGNTTILNSAITNNPYGIYHTGGVTTVHNSSIHDNYQYGILNITTDTLDAASNWWGSAGGPTYGANPLGAGDKVSNYVNYGAWLDGEPQGTCVLDCYSNVLFLPGVAGSRLYEVSELESQRCDSDRGTGYFKRWLPQTDCDNTKLLLNPDGSSIKHIVTKDVVDEAGGVPNIYASFLDDLSSWKNIEHLINDYSVVAYDWRLSMDSLLNSGNNNTLGYIDYSQNLNSTQAPYIMSELLHMAETSKTHKVTIVAHSTGGLITKALMLRLRAKGMEDIVDKIIFVAVPQVGSPEAVATLLHGGSIGPLGIISDKRQTRALVQNMPTAYNLLPSTSYFQTPISRMIPVATFDNLGLYGSERVSYGPTVGNSDELIGYLLGIEVRPVPDYSDLNAPSKANTNLLESALFLHDALDAWVPTPRTKVIELAGWGEYTIAGLQYGTETYCSKSHTEASYFDFRTVTVCDEYSRKKILNDILTISGDETVVSDSAHYLSDKNTPNVERWWVDLHSYNPHGLHRRFTIARVHKDIFEVADIRDFIKNKITGSFSTLDFIATTKPSSVTDIIIYKLHSPLTLNLYDKEGRHTGISTTTGEIEENIPGTRYQEVGDTKSIIADADIEQHLMLMGYATGSFSLGIEKLSGDSITASTTFSAIPTSASTTVTLDLPANADIGAIAIPAALKIDFNGDGIVDTELISKPDQEVIYDVTPPEVEISFDQQNKALKVRGYDTVSSTTVTTSASSTIIADQAGNSTELTFSQYKIKPKKIELVISSIKQNGVVVSTSTTLLAYKWNTTTGTSTIFKTLASYLKTPDKSVETHYRPKQGQTIVMTTPLNLSDADDGDDVDQRATKEKLSGIHVVKLMTDHGRIKVSY